MMEEKKKVWKKPFEGCYKLKDGTYSDEGFFEEELSALDDARFKVVLKKVRKR